MAQGRVMGFREISVKRQGIKDGRSTPFAEAMKMQIAEVNNAGENSLVACPVYHGNVIVVP